MAIKSDEKDTYYKLQKAAGTATTAASPTGGVRIDRRTAIKQMKKQISQTFNTRTKQSSVPIIKKCKF